MGASGCAHRYYHATTLPADFVVPPTENVNTASLSRLADNAASAELIGPGDLLEVTIDEGYGEDGEDPVRSWPVWVGEDGAARVPPIGAVHLAGLTPRDAGRVIAAASNERGVYVPPYPYVTVEMKRQRTNRVTVIGAVESPGVKQLPRSSSYLLTALVAAGNLTDRAGPEIQIIQCDGGRNPTSPASPRVADGPNTDLTSFASGGVEGPRTILVDLAGATEHAEWGPVNHYLEDGDVVVVREREPRSVHVIGLVKEPGEYELSPNRDLHVLGALAQAGGRTTQIADKVWVLRRVPGQEDPVRIRVSIREAKRDGEANVRLAAGDVVSVEETPATFVLDLMRNFIRFGLSSSVPLF
jgi:polysaccharide export outer membrane protein